MAKKPKASNGDSLDFRDKLWQAADELRGSIDAAEYKHVVLGLIFLKYISDTFAAYRAELDARSRDSKSEWYCGTQEERDGLLEDRDEYTAAGVFWVPAGARWPEIKGNAKQPRIAQTIDDAMYAIEEANPKRLKGVLPRNYAGKGIPPERLGKLIDIISGIELYRKQEDGGHAGGQDLIGRVYEYFLGKFAAAEGKLGGEFYTPRCVVRLLVEMIEPYKGRVFDPCCGSGGMFVQSEEFITEHRGNIKDISVFGQESNPTTWKLCRMNLAIHGLEANLGPRHADSFLEDLHPDLRADFILANPPFNVSSWNGELVRKDARWEFGIPPAGNANYAWIQHFIYHLAPPNGKGGGVAGFVMANGSLSSGQSGEGEIRRKIVEADLVDCIVALPPQLFLTTGIPVCLWFLRKGKLTKVKLVLRLPNPEISRHAQDLYDRMLNGGIREFAQKMYNPRGLSQAEGQLPHAAAELAAAGYKNGAVQLEGVRDGKRRTVKTGRKAARGSIDTPRDVARGMLANAKSKETQKCLAQLIEEMDKVSPPPSNSKAKGRQRERNQ